MIVDTSAECVREIGVPCKNISRRFQSKFSLNSHQAWVLRGNESLWYRIKVIN